MHQVVPEAAALGVAEEGALSGFEREVLAEALQGLPSRWRTVLWMTEVDGLGPAEVAERLKIKPNAAAALAYPARRRLRVTYLQAHLRVEPDGECRETVLHLGDYVRGGLVADERAAVDGHLEDCGRCRRRAEELSDLNATLRRALAPLAPLPARFGELAPALSGGSGPGLMGRAAVAGAAAALALTGAGGPRAELPAALPVARPVAPAPAPAALETGAARAAAPLETGVDERLSEPEVVSVAQALDLTRSVLGPDSALALAVAGRPVSAPLLASAVPSATLRPLAARSVRPPGSSPRLPLAGGLRTAGLSIDLRHLGPLVGAAGQAAARPVPGGPRVPR